MSSSFDLKINSIYDFIHLAKSFELKSLKTPKLPTSYISIAFKPDKNVPCYTDMLRKRPVPMAASEIVEAQFVAGRRLTEDSHDVKKTLELTVEFKGEAIPYQPGDSFGFICSNPSREVSLYLKNLDALSNADMPCEVSVREEFQKSHKVPSHIPSFSTLRHLFTSCIDIRAVAKKLLLRVLSEYTDDRDERNALLFLSSTEGSVYYTTCITQSLFSVLDILNVFPSCHVPVELLLEHLPPLKPRFYSVASSPLQFSNSFKIVFSVVEIPNNYEKHFNHKGICTGWFENISSEQINAKSAGPDITDGMAQLTISKNQSLPSFCLYKRLNRCFYMPEDPKVPIIMVGPGTGVAPFIGFLQHREQQLAEADVGLSFGEMWLFYGCRYRDKDLLYREELQRLKSCSVLTHLFLSFSRDGLCQDIRFVQDNIRHCAVKLSELIDKGAVIYACGDAKHMAQDIQDAFSKVFQVTKGYTEEESRAYMKELINQQRYIIDVWA